MKYEGAVLATVQHTPLAYACLLVAVYTAQVRVPVLFA